MQNSTPIFPGFHLQTLRRTPRTRQQRLAAELAELKTKSIDQLGEVFRGFIGSGSLDPAASGPNSRRRLYSKANTFWAFLSQVLHPDPGCQEVVRKMQSYAALKGLAIPSSSTASYCEARVRLPEQDLRAVFERTAMEMDRLASEAGTFGRRVVVADGTGLSMPDTATNQHRWPQQSQQKPGCGFPSMKLTACFSLQSGALLSYATGSKHTHELTLLRSQWDVFRPGDILLADKGFCNYRDLATLSEQGVDSLMAMRKKYPIKEAKALRQLGHDDLLVSWSKPQRVGSFSAQEWDTLPSRIRLRQIRVRINIPGFRSREIYLITTLLDEQKYPAAMLADLYFQRWDVELFFRDIKITMGMDVLRCKSPEMIRKELLMHLIAYNCVRRLMLEAAEEAGLAVRTVSFKGALQALRNWEPHLNQLRISRNERFRLISELYACITDKTLCIRPERSEPRAVKRRPKNHHLLTKPRNQMVVPKHRNRNWLNKGEKALS